MKKTYVFGYVIQDIGLQWHVHINSAYYPTQLTLSDIENAVFVLRDFSANLGRISFRQISGNTKALH